MKGIFKNPEAAFHRYVYGRDHVTYSIEAK
jgi:hypothetical protein